MRESMGLTASATLLVALAVALISAVGSYMTAMRATSRAARQELLAAKRVAYAQALSDISLAVSGEADSTDNTRQKLNDALAQLAVLGSQDLRNYALNWPHIAEHIFVQWPGLRSELLELMVEDLANTAS